LFISCFNTLHVQRESESIHQSSVTAAAWQMSQRAGVIFAKPVKQIKSISVKKNKTQNYTFIANFNP